MGVSVVNFLDTTDSSTLNKYTVDTHAQLLVILDAEEGNLAHVRNTSGNLNPFTSTKLKGLWEYKSGVWEYASQDLQDKLVTQQAEIEANDTDISTLQSDKLDKGGYPGTAQDLKDEIDNSGTVLPSGGYTGTGQDLDDDNKGSIDIHNDVDLSQGVTPKNGWVPKYVNGQLILCMKEQGFYRGNPIVNTNSNNPSGNQNLEFDFEFQRLGDYMFTIKANESIDTTSSDIVIRPLIDGQTVTTRVNGEILRREGKEVQGNDNDGRGTDQKNQMGNTYYYNNTSIGTKTIRIDHYPTDGDTIEASIWDVFIEIEEIFDPIVRN